MNPNTPQIDDLLLFIGQISVAIIAISGALALLNKFIFGKMRSDLQDIKKELHPNGGSSMRDAIDRNAIATSEIKQEIDNLYSKIDDHIQWHLDHSDGRAKTRRED